jgi:hypothetical protein
MSPEDVENRLIVHDQIKAKIDRNGEQMKLKLKAGDRIFVLPDPSYLVCVLVSMQGKSRS